MIKIKLRKLSEFVYNNDEKKYIVIGFPSQMPEIPLIEVCFVTKELGHRFSDCLINAFNIEAISGQKFMKDTYNVYIMKGRLSPVTLYTLKEKAFFIYEITSSLANDDKICDAYFSINSLKVIFKRNQLCYDKKFINKITELKRVLFSKNIDINEIVITNGSVLEACGIRKSGDIDLIVSDKVRRGLQINQRVELSNGVEIKPHNSYSINDNAIIYNEKNYFCVMGCKFMSIDLCLRNNLKKIKKEHNRKDAIAIMKYILSQG